MKCTKCQSETDVVDTREKDNVITRRRTCKNETCGHRFLTEEKFARETRPYVHRPPGYKRPRPPAKEKAPEVSPACPKAERKPAHAARRRIEELREERDLDDLSGL